MKSKIYLIVLLFSSMVINAQTYSWQWAKTGGANNGSSGTGFNQREDEHILDMVVDNQNNTYYLTSIYNQTPLLDGQAVTNYGGKDLLLFSTNCQGNVRWTRTVGGSSNAGSIQKIVLDNNGGLYVTTYITNNATPGSGNLPPRFGDNDAMPITSNDIMTPQAALRSGFLLKYDTSDGNLVWRRDFQGDVSFSNMYMEMSGPVIDSTGKIHVIVGLSNGTHLGGLVTVPGNYNTNNNFQYYLVKYDSLGNIVGTPALLPLAGSTTFLGGYLNFIYDETNSRYYLAGARNYDGGGAQALSWNNIAINKTGFLLSFSSTTFNELWRREIDTNSTLGAEFIYSLKKDPVTSDIYISGRFFRSSNQVMFGNDFTFATPLIGSIPFVMKLSTSNTGSNVLWCTYPNTLSDGSINVASANARTPIAIKNNEVFFAKGSIKEVWGAFPMIRPTNDGTDPLLVKLNKDTGTVTGIHEVLGNFGSFDQFTAIAVDNDNNIMLGGFINQQLFVDPNDGVPTISNVTNTTKTDFFFAKLGTSASCTVMATAETPVKESDVVFYPNPVEDVLQIQTKEKLDRYQVITIDGRLIKQGLFEKSKYIINMQGLTKGVYYVKVQGEGFATAEKIFKK